VRVDSWARVERSVLLNHTQVGRRAVVRNAILDKHTIVTAGATVGVDKEHDRARGFVVSDGGVTVVGKGQLVTPLPAAQGLGEQVGAGARAGQYGGDPVAGQVVLGDGGQAGRRGRLDQQAEGARSQPGPADVDGR
jgi:NDP-sugar pyrophosphorylase family protein